jgi:hypothetical protein
MEINPLCISILALRLQIIKLENNLKFLLASCSHDDLTISTGGMCAVCNICEKRFEWYCPTSPTKECVYEQEDGSYDIDSCRYCYQPDERK